MLATSTWNVCEHITFLLIYKPCEYKIIHILCTNHAKSKGHLHILEATFYVYASRVLPPAGLVLLKTTVFVITRRKSDKKVILNVKISVSLLALVVYTYGRFSVSGGRWWMTQPEVSASGTWIMRRYLHHVQLEEASPQGVTKEGKTTTWTWYGTLLCFDWESAIPSTTSNIEILLFGCLHLMVERVPGL